MAGHSLVCLLVLASVICQTYADIYLHNPRGSNNRFNERSATRRNGNRVFDSQNNARGGYNVGEKKANSDQRYGHGQYHMQYFQSDNQGGETELMIEWTNQHGCGGNEQTDPHKLNCNLVLQYMCQDKKDKSTPILPNDMRNGLNTATNDFTRRSPNSIEKETESRIAGLKKANARMDRVLQEPWEWYDKCRNRIRNKGLFTADQKLKGEESIYTRQNANGNRRGYECPEERDYYPYWHPTPFVDIAVMADSKERCDYFKKHSFSTEVKHECMQKFPGSNSYRHNSRHNNEKDCKANGGQWMDFMSHIEVLEGLNENQCKAKAQEFQSVKIEWGRPMNSGDKKCLVRPSPVACLQKGYWSRVNHLGNGREGVPLRYTWKLPFFPSNKDKTCVFRIRYNISTDDYDPMKTDSTYNKDSNSGKASPIEGNPDVDIGLRNAPLRLAINTAQFGRTFQDRTHIFQLLTRSNKPKLLGKKIKNLNVRGKRGNIVQTFPAVEYDFIPTRMNIKEDELVHVQWTGCNTHNNGNPAGDGQAGDAGEGTGGTDRHNMVEMPTPDVNYPYPMEKSDMVKNAEVVHALDEVLVDNPKMEDLYVSLASSGFFNCYKGSNPKCMDKMRSGMQSQLNNAPPSYPGVVLKFKKGEYYYMCSRNNNFTNRSQKGQLKVEAKSK